MSRCLYIALCAGSVCVSLSASAQVITWNGAVSGNWNDITRWTPGIIPVNSGHTAIFNPGMYNPRLNLSVAINSVTVGNGAQLDIQAGQSLGITGTDFTNNSQIYVNSTAAAAGTNIVVSGVPTTTALGSGRISLNASLDLNTATLNTGPGSTFVNSASHIIEGSGRIYATLVNNGLIRANLGGKYLQIVGSVTGGTFEASGGFAGIGNGGQLISSVLTCSFGGKGRIDGNGTLSDVTTTPQCTLEINPGSVMHLTGTAMTNNGFVVVNPTAAAAGTVLRFDAPVTLGGSGSVVLNASPDLNTAYIDGVAVGTNGSLHTISGTGRIFAQMNNLGTIQGDVAGRSLEVRNAVVQTGGGRMRGVSGGFAAMGNGSLVTGGTFESASGGVVKVTGGETGTINGVTNNGAMQVDAGGVLALQSGGLVDNGTVIVNPLALSAGTVVRFTQNATVSGSGTLTLNANGDLNTAYIDASPGVTGSNAAPHTITGTGRIYAPMTNTGIVLGGTPNNYLEIRNTFAQAGGGRIIGEGTGSVALGNGSVISGGTFESVGDGFVRTTSGATGIVDGVTNLGAFHVDPGSVLALRAGGLVNNGIITVNPTAASAGTSVTAAVNATLGGSGTLILNANGDLNTAMITTADNLTVHLTNGLQHVITGNGNVYAPIDNNGVIAGSPASATAIVALRGTVNQFGNGQIVGNVGSPGLAGCTVNGGRFTGVGRVRALPASSAVNGVTNTTTFALDAGAVVRVTNFVNNGTVLVNSTSTSAGTSITFQGTQTLTGTGTVQLASNGDLNTATLNVIGTNAVATLGVGQTLRGIGRLYGAYVLEGITAPGVGTTIGHFDNSGNLTLGSNHTLILKVMGTPAGEFDRIYSGGTIALTGALNASFINGYDPTTPCTEFQIVRADGGLSGKFSSELLPPAPDGFKWRIAYTNTTATLRLSCLPDFNVDCVVDFFDYLDFVDAFAIMDRSSDFNNDGIIDFFDYLDFVDAFSQGC